MADTTNWNWGGWFTPEVLAQLNARAGNAPQPTVAATPTPIAPVAPNVAPQPTNNLTDVYGQYQTLFGRAPDVEGAQYWAGTGLSGQALTNALMAGAQGSDITAMAQKAPTSAGLGNLIQNVSTAAVPTTPVTPTAETGYGNAKIGRAHV